MGKPTIRQPKTDRTVPGSEALIAPALADLAVPLDSVTPYPRNARHGDVGAISESLKRFGQHKPIVVQESTGYILAGNHLWHAARALGWPSLAVNRIAVDDETALALMIADNRTAELGSYDDEALANILRELASTNNLTGVGYDGDDVDALLRELTDLGDVPLPGSRADADAFHSCPKCGFEWRIIKH